MSDSVSDRTGGRKSSPPATRQGGRSPDQQRPFTLQTGYTMHAEGSVLVSSGDTNIICTASVEDRVPAWMRGTGRGWLTAEYAMLPRATHSRSPRTAPGDKPNARALEIQRLIGRSLRAALNPDALGERTIYIDCDVIQADGGTRTAAIAGGFVAMVLALRKVGAEAPYSSPPVTRALSAVSVGISGGQPLLDLDYAEDVRADVDLNVVMDDRLSLIEVQGNAEGDPFSRGDLNAMLDQAERGIRERIGVQLEALGGHLVHP